MYARIVTFRLDGPSREAYQDHAAVIAESVNQWPGLQSVVWLAHQGGSRYGGMYLFDSAAAADASREAPEFLSLLRLPVYKDVLIEEFDVLAEPTAITGGWFAAPSRAA